MDGTKKPTNPTINDQARFIVDNYIREHLDKSDPANSHNFSTYVVWQCYILGNAKWLISSTLPDGMYYEVTYNKEKNAFYLDAYRKFENREIQGA